MTLGEGGVMADPVLVLTIEVDAEPDPATCDIVIGMRPSIRGPTPWTDKARRIADHMASDILDDREGTAEVKEEGVHRRYRIPLRVQDGWSSVDLADDYPRPDEELEQIIEWLRGLCSDVSPDEVASRIEQRKYREDR